MYVAVLITAERSGNMELLKILASEYGPSGREEKIRDTIIKYANAIKKMDVNLWNEEKIYPTIIPNWDHTPRSGNFGRVFQDSTPELFSKHIDSIFKRIINKAEENRIVFLKSWNEWGEGNYIEPDLKYGTQYIDVLAEVLSKYN